MTSFIKNNQNVKENFSHSSGFLLPSALEFLKKQGFNASNDTPNILHTCSTEDRPKDKRFGWYRLDETRRGLTVTYGAFNVDKAVERFDALAPAYTPKQPTTPPKRQNARTPEQESQRAAKVAHALLAASDTTDTPEYFGAKGFTADMWRCGVVAMTGDALERALTPHKHQFAILLSVRRVRDYRRRVFGVSPAYRYNDEFSSTLASVQIFFPEKVVLPSGNVGNKAFLAGKGSQTGAWLSLSPLKPGRRVYLCEGVAKGFVIQAARPDACVVVVYGVAKLPACVEWLQAHNLTDIVNAADNGDAGLRMAERLRRDYGIDSAWPVFPGADDFDDLWRLAGADEVSRQLDIMRGATAARWIALSAAAIPDTPSDAIRLDGYMSPREIFAPLCGQSLHVVAPCGAGKTTAVVTAAQGFGASNVVNILPTSILRDQFAERSGWQAVKDGDPIPVNIPRLAMTRDKAAQIPVDEIINNNYVFIEDEEHLLVADRSYKAGILDKYEAKAELTRRVGMTGTPLATLQEGIDLTARFIRPDRRILDAVIVRYTDTIEAIREAVRRADGGVVAVELNSKDTIRAYASLLDDMMRDSGRRVYQVYRDPDSEKPTPDAVALQSGKLPADCGVILATSLVECGVSIEAAVDTVQVFPRLKRHDTRHAAELLAMRHEIAQFATRFRGGYKRLEILLPSNQSDTPTPFDAARRREMFLDAARKSVDAIEAREAAEGDEATPDRVRREIDDNMRHYVRRDADGRPVVNMKGVDYLVLEATRSNVSRDLTAYIRHLAASSDMPIRIVAVETCGEAAKATKEAVKQSLEVVEMGDLDAYRIEIERITTADTLADPEAVGISRAEKAVSRLAEIIGKDDAISMIQNVMNNANTVNKITQDVNKLISQARTARHLTGADGRIDPTLQRLVNIAASKKEWDAAEWRGVVVAECKRDRVLRNGAHLIRQESTTRLLHTIATVRVLKSNDDRKQQIDDVTPFATAYENATKKTLTACNSWTRFCTRKKPGNGSKSAETQGKCFLTSLKKEKKVLPCFRAVESSRIF